MCALRSLKNSSKLTTFTTKNIFLILISVSRVLVSSRQFSSWRLWHSTFVAGWSTLGSWYSVWLSAGWTSSTSPEDPRTWASTASWYRRCLPYAALPTFGCHLLWSPDSLKFFSDNHTYYFVILDDSWGPFSFSFCLHGFPLWIFIRYMDFLLNTEK